MGAVVSIHSRRTFTREEAEEMLPIIRHITAQSAAHAQDVSDQLRWIPSGEPLRLRLEQELSLVVQRWELKISRLGGIPRGIWLVDFDAGDGWFSWRFGDEELCSFHSHGQQDEHRKTGRRRHPATSSVKGER